MRNVSQYGNSRRQWERKFGWGILLALLAWMMVGCSEKSEDPVGVAAPPTNTARPSKVSSEPPGATGKNRTIGVSLPERNTFYLALVSAMEAAAKLNSITLDFQFADGQADKQQQQIEAFIRNRMDAILFSPADPQKSATGIQKANTAQIPIFTVHIRSAEGNVKAHIGTDEVLGGKLAAQKIAELLKDQGNVLLQEVPNDSNKDQADRAKGFQEEIAHHPSLHLLHLWEVGRQGQPNAIFYVNDEWAAQLQSAGDQSKGEAALMVGYGGEASARAEIRKRQNYKADVSPDPIQLGATALDAIARSLRGEKTDPFVKVVPEVIDASSVDKP